MNADLRRGPSSSPALASRRTRRASTQTRSRGDSTSLASGTLTHQRRSSVQTPAQQQEAHPHQADSANCLCTACHLRVAVFPRRRDGVILLPFPWESPSDSADEVSRDAPQLPGEMEHHVHHVAETTRSNEYALHNWARRPEGSSIRGVRDERHTDRGEGGSRGVPRLSGPGVAPSEDSPSVQRSHLNISGHVEAKRRRSNADRSKSYRYPKPYNKPSEQGGPTVHPAGLGHFEFSHRPGVDPSTVYLHHPSSLAASQSIPEMEPWREPYGSIGAGASRSFEPRAQSVNPALPPISQSFSPGAPSDHGFSTLPTSTLGSRPPLHPPNPPLDRSQVQSASWHSSQKGSQTIPHLQPSSSLDTRFNTHSTPENSRRAASRTASTVDSSRQTKFPAPTAAPSSSSFTWRPGDDEEENVIRFQEPVVHDPTIVSDNQDGQVEIKWDTERKRRQGYFSQAEEGSEKSNFRLYNQSKIDFGS